MIQMPELVPSPDVVKICPYHGSNRQIALQSKFTVDSLAARERVLHEVKTARAGPVDSPTAKGRVLHEGKWPDQAQWI